MQGGFPRRKKDIHSNSHKFKEGAEYATSVDTFNDSVSPHRPEWQSSEDCGYVKDENSRGQVSEQQSRQAQANEQLVKSSPGQ